MVKPFECGHAKPVPKERTQSDDSRKIWYWPLFGVYHPRKPIRSKAMLLNKELLSGPDVHNNLLGILIRFGRDPVGVMCNVEQTFHNFYVCPPHRDLLQFLQFADNDRERNQRVSNGGALVWQYVKPCYSNVWLKKNSRT